ncbi:hypothetical protein F5Y16DRAFT_378511 [Xylariaceae sp. FL0255]|nr:hypothetical protein F5Y16DRAFT_378511 [Xylariaceae sp. FL0255]
MPGTIISESSFTSVLVCSILLGFGFGFGLPTLLISLDPARTRGRFEIAHKQPGNLGVTHQATVNNSWKYLAAPSCWLPISLYAKTTWSWRPCNAQNHCCEIQFRRVPIEGGCIKNQVAM